MAQTPLRVEITGSAIRQAAGSTPLPVETITRRDIERSGATTLNALMRSIASLDIADHGELTADAPSGAGTASVRLRGLDEVDVLVLLDGRRLPPNPLADLSGAGAGVDLNLIPLALVERIEILKDGGSALYGTDAIAGVVNIITRRQADGTTLSAGFGRSSRGDGRERHASLSTGTGDLAQDGYHLLVGLNVFKRDPILRADRDISSSADFRRLGGDDARSYFAPGGNLLDAAGNLSPYRTCPADSLDADGACRYDFNRSTLTAYNGADRLGAMAVLRVEPDAVTRLRASLLYSRSEDHFTEHPAADWFELPDPDPAAAAGSTVWVAGRFMQGGPRQTERSASLLNLALAASGQTGDLDWKLGVSHGRSRVLRRSSNYFDRTLWNDALASGRLDPTRDDNDAALVDALKVQPTRLGRQSVSSLDGLIGGQLGSLSPTTEPVRYAIGAALWREQLSDQPDALTAAGLVFGQIQQSGVEAGRNAAAVFGELQIPLDAQWQLQASLRHDHYSAASATSPKLALRYLPTPTLALRASYSLSFRMPLLKQLHGLQDQGAVTISEDADCQGLGAAASCNLTAFQISGANPALRPERGRTLDLGLTADLDPDTTLGLDLWQITKTDAITELTLSEAIRLGRYTQSNGLYRIETQLQNVARRSTRGLDVDLRTRWNTTLGQFVLRDSATRYLSLRSTTADAQQDLVDLLGTYAKPKWRNVLSLALERGTWIWTASLRTVAGFWDQLQPQPVQAGTRRVPSHSEVDLVASVRAAPDWSFSAGVLNLLDRMPPFSATNAAQSAYSQMGFAELYHSRGRYWQLALQHRF